MMLLTFTFGQRSQRLTHSFSGVCSSSTSLNIQQWPASFWSNYIYWQCKFHYSTILYSGSQLCPQYWYGFSHDLQYKWQVFISGLHNLLAGQLRLSDSTDCI